MNYFIVTLVFIILISQDIFLFNEESLILICFISFCFISVKNLNFFVNSFFQSNSKKIEITFTNSFTPLLVVLIQKIKWLSKLKKLKLYFNFLKNYYNYFNYEISNKLNNYQNYQIQLKFNSKMNFIVLVEAQFLKLLILLLIQKIQKISTLNQFFNSKLKIKTFQCFHKILLREYFDAI